MRLKLTREQALKRLVDAKIQLSNLKVEDLILDGFEGETEEEIFFDWARYEYGASSNELLAELVEFLGDEAVFVVGDAEKLFPCPCCGFHTLTEPGGQYDICRWCDWEDDGRTDPKAVYSPNHFGSMEAHREMLRKENRHKNSQRWGKSVR